MRIERRKRLGVNSDTFFLIPSEENRIIEQQGTVNNRTFVLLNFRSIIPALTIILYIYIYIIYQNIFIQCVQLVVQDTYYIYAQVLDHRFPQKWGTRKTSSDSVPPTYPQKTPQSTMVLLFPADFFPRFTALIEGKVYRESSFLPLKSRKYIDDSLGLHSSINLWEGSFPWFPVNFPHQPIPG